MPHTFLSLLYHIVFSTHDRQPQIQPDIRDPLFRYMAGIVKHLDSKALLINGMPDHVHLLCRLRAAHPLAEVVQKVKANSSRWVHSEHGRLNCIVPAGTRNHCWEREGLDTPDSRPGLGLSCP